VVEGGIFPGDRGRGDGGMAGRTGWDYAAERLSREFIKELADMAANRGATRREQMAYARKVAEGLRGEGRDVQAAQLVDRAEVGPASGYTHAGRHVPELRI